MKIRSSQLLYRCSDSNGSYDSWYKKVGGKANTIIFCKTKSGHVLGGFTPLAWSNEGGHVAAPGTFQFLYKEDGLVVYLPECTN